VNALRTALFRFSDDPIVQSAFYSKSFEKNSSQNKIVFFQFFTSFFFVVKYNKITQGLISQGQCARDINLFTTDGQPATLFSQISAGQPLIILAGSTS
jgi:hypothetical protein